MATSVADDKWYRLSAGDGAKGSRLYYWARVALDRLNRLGLADGEEPRWGHWLLVRRSIEKPEKPEELAYYVAFCPVGTTLEELVM